jgi:hypothetical protein
MFRIHACYFLPPKKLLMPVKTEEATFPIAFPAPVITLLADCKRPLPPLLELAVAAVDPAVVIGAL